ncbi:tetratricopeptide repeat protein [bacterium]|nr:tetratricopeptide repeat protein [bacterium]
MKPIKYIILVLFVGTLSSYPAEVQRDYLKMAFEAHTKKMYNLSNLQLEKHIKENPNLPDLDYAFLLYAVNYIQLNQYNEAITKLTFLKTHYPNSPYLKNTFTYLILAYLKTQEINSAVLSYRDYKKKFGTDTFVEKQVEEILLQSAILFFNKGETSHSLEFFNLFLEEFSNSEHLPTVYYYRGLIYYRENNFLKAKDFFKRALEGSSSLKNIDILADTHLKLADSLLNLRESKEASVIYKEINEKFSDTIYNIWASFRLSIIEKRNDNFLQAEVLLNSIKGKGDEELNYRILYELANIKILREDWQSAQEELNLIIKTFPQNPNIPEIYMQLGFIYFNLGKFEESVQVFNKSLVNATTPQIKEKSFFGLGYSYYSSGNITESFKVWEQFVKEFPDSPFLKEVFFLQGKTFYEKKDYLKAEKSFGLIISNFPESALYKSSIKMFIESLIEQKKFKEAKQICEDSLAKEVDETITFLYGKTLYLLKEYKKSGEIFEKLSVKNPELDVEAKYYLAKIYEYQGDNAKAQDKFLEIMTFYKNFPNWTKIAEESIKRLQK